MKYKHISEILLSLIKENDSNLLKRLKKIGDIDVVKFLVEKNILDLNTYGTDVQEMLFRAVLEKHTEVVKFLIEKGADIECKDRKGNTLLHIAVSSKISSMELVKFLVEDLIEKEINIDIKNREGYTPLFYALINNSTGIANFLIEKGADINSKNLEGDAPIHKLILCDDIGRIGFLLEKGADVNIKNKRGRTPLHIIANDTLNMDNSFEKAKLLIKKGALTLI